MTPDNNPYAAPQVDLVDAAPAPVLEGWSASQLRMLGWLSLVSVLGAVVLLGIALASGLLDDPILLLISTWLSPAVTILGCYLLLRMKAFAEQRFSATGLSNPVWAVVIVALLLSSFELIWGDATSQLGVPMFVYFGLMCVYGALLTWLGIRLRQAKNVYPVFNLMAWLNIIGGIMLATVILIVLALFPLIGASVAMALVFFKAAGEVSQAS
ncbi:hypothetical protein SAMN05216600_101274 [Pseudomonas cuatrocienegasensis]|uniref:DUF308 domain-containing protein n=1 Tax=Pseudomonas cuatrocienegasensis TaxID=543360 RepID=A0ABY1B156_9PSED|nr:MULTISPECIES: hypothetical protein [Pseudomonas]OEC36558.1 hypothetical protein A7D25_05235 [Pseudomonas sp. 21C1]SEP67352.1 hypothetical protein SAMN05216600_101274 [Pseudomonas cuatrocienegasensis]